MEHYRSFRYNLGRIVFDEDTSWRRKLLRGHRPRYGAAALLAAAFLGLTAPNHAAADDFDDPKRVAELLRQNIDSCVASRRDASDALKVRTDCGCAAGLDLLKKIISEGDWGRILDKYSAAVRSDNWSLKKGILDEIIFARDRCGQALYPDSPLYK